MKTETQKPTLASLELTATVSPCGVSAMNDGESMCAWFAIFTNKRGQSERFDYFTGAGCPPIASPATYEQWLRQEFPLVANVPKHNRHNIKDKTLLCRIAAKWAAKIKWTPDLIEILWAIARDGDALESTFEDWSSEFGYDADSRKAEKIYRACQDNALRLKKLLTREQIEILKGLEL